MNKIYPADLTDAQRQFIERILDDKRKCKHNLGIIWNAILCLVKSGCQWRILLRNFPHYLRSAIILKSGKKKIFSKKIMDMVN